MVIEVWSDVVCPWCYLGKRRLEHALAQAGSGREIDVVHRAFQLDTAAPTDHTVETATVLSQRYGLTPERVAQVQQEMEQRAAADGLTYRLEGQRTGNTLDAHRLVHLARVHEREEEVLEALYRAYFTEQRSVFDAASLTAIGSEAGLPDDEVADLLAGERFAGDVRADLDQAAEYGIQGVPFFVLDGRLAVSGAQPVEVLVAAIEQAYAPG